MSRVWLMLLVGLSVVNVLPATPQPPKKKRPLDLPIAGFRVDDDEEAEDEDLTEIIFYGRGYEGDAFFWCLDRSGSMNQEDRMGILKQEVTAAIQSLTSRTDFGIVSFADAWTAWQTRPVRATLGLKPQAQGWVDSLQAAGSTCMATAAVETIRLARISKKQSKTIIIVSDGSPNCPGCGETVAAIQAANYDGIPVHTLLLGSDAVAEACMRDIAEGNDGSFRRIE